MKRIGNLYQRICSLDNLRLADTKARKGKAHQYGVQAHDRNQDGNLQLLHRMLVNRSYRTSTYMTFKIYEPKEREIFRLPYFPDRIAHHAVMNVLEPIFVSCFTADTYSCIKGKGIHAAAAAVRRALQDKAGTRYCLKIDIKKFYPSIDHEILKAQLRRKLKDPYLLWLLDGIIDSAPGLPIGNYLSQYFANFFLCGFDRWIKQEKHVRYYFRYADDIVILSDSKPYLHQLLAEIRAQLAMIKLSLKENYQVFPVEARGIDFVGYRFFHTHVALRKSIKQRFARMVRYNNNPASWASYYGWAAHCDSKHLLKKLTNEKL